MTVRLLAAVLVALAAARPAAAQQPAPIAAPLAPIPAVAAGDSAPAARVERLVVLSYSPAVHAETVERAMKQLQQNLSLPAAALTSLRAFFDRNVGYDAIRADQVRAIRETYTAAEVERLIALFDSPAGQLLARKQALVMARAQEAQTTRLQAKQGELVQILQGAMSP